MILHITTSLCGFYRVTFFITGTNHYFQEYDKKKEAWCKGNVVTGSLKKWAS